MANEFVKSEDPRYLPTNAATLDEYVHSDSDTFRDRVGRERLTIKGIEHAAGDASLAVQAATNARDSEQAARSSEQTAAANAAASGAAKALAEAARDAAALAALAAPGLYATEAEGRAAVVDGETFKVQGTGEVAIRLFRRISSTDSNFIADIPAAAAVENLKSLITPSSLSERSHEFADERGFILAWLETNGFFRSNGFDVGAVSKITATEDGSLAVGSLHIKETAGDDFEIIGEDGFILFPQKPQETSTTPPPLETVSQVINFGGGGQKRSAIMHVLVYGQSLSRGNSSIPAISGAQPFSNLMFKSGVLERPQDPNYDPTGFIPLVETTYSTSGDGVGESPTAGICNGIVSRIVEDGDSHSDWVFAGSAVGQGGARVAALSEGALFNGIKQTITDAKKLSDSLGKSYSVWAHAWFQGEDDNNVASPNRIAGKYVDAWLSLYSQLNKHIIETTGQDFIPYLFTYQDDFHVRRGYDEGQPGIAKWRASKIREDVVLASPCYIFPRAADHAHLSNIGSWLMGQYVARAMHQTMYRRAGKFRPLEPIDIDWTDAHIDVKYHVPVKPIVIDTALCAATHNSGFDVRDGSGAVLSIISNVAAVSSDTVRITLSSPAPADAVLSCARGRPGDPARGGPVDGPRSNVRDSAGVFDVVTSPAGSSHAMHNASVMFTYSRKSGF